MNRMRVVAASFGVAALMAVVAACGSAAEPTPLSDEVSTPAPPTVGGTAPEEEPNASDSPIEFVMEDHYALGQEIEIKIKNNGTTSYVYSEYYPACNNLEFYYGSQEARQLETLEGSVELPPGLFIVPEGTHCDIANESQIKPGEEVVLLTWSQHECVKDKWGCIESVPLKAGRYTIVGGFPESIGSSEPDALSFEKGDKTVVDWSFTIGPSERLSIPPVSSGSMLPYPTGVEQLVGGADVIVLGIISSILEEKQIGPYRDDGKALPARDDGMPVTDYEVQIETVLTGYDALADGDTLVLRMFGHRSSQGGAITSVISQLPNPGDRLLFALGRNPDGTYGTGRQGLLDVSGEAVSFADGVPFEPRTSPDQLMEYIRDLLSK